MPELFFFRLPAQRYSWRHGRVRDDLVPFVQAIENASAPEREEQVGVTPEYAEALGNPCELSVSTELDPGLLASLIDSVEEAVFVTDLQGTFTYLNSCARQEWLPLLETLGDPSILQVLATDQAEGFSAVWEAVLRGGNDEVPLLCRFRSAYRPEKSFTGIGTLSSVHRNGEILGVRGRIRDLTELESVNQELSEEKELLDSMLQSVGVGIIIVDRNRNLYYQNGNALQRYGRPANRKCFAQFGRQDPCPGCVLDSIMAGEESASLTVQGSTKDRRDLWVEVLASPIRDKNRHMIGIVEVLTDISTRKRIEGELIQTGKLVALGEMVAGIAHEINNPLAVIMGYTQIAQAKMMGVNGGEEGDRAKDLENSLRTILSETERASKIVRNLLTFARKSNAERTLLQINDVIRRTVDLQRYSLQVEGVEIETDLERGLPIVVGDSNLIQQVAVNLINNAVAAMKSHGGPHKLRILTRSQGKRVIARFEDNGPGIPETILGRIFDPFFTTKETGKGSGLGLSICHGIMEQHRGTIRAENRTEGGASFEIDFPAAENEDIQTAVVRESRGHVPKAAAKRVLLVDDEPNILYLMEEALRTDRHRIVTARDGSEALSHLERSQFDLVLVDIRMPNMDGREFFRRVKAGHPALADRVVFVTGDVLSPDTLTFLQETGNPYLLKPFSLDRIRQVVSGVFRGHSSGNGG